MVEFCHKCGNQIELEDSQFCNKCGAKLPIISPIIHPPVIRSTTEQRRSFKYSGLFQLVTISDLVFSFFFGLLIFNSVNQSSTTGYANLFVFLWGIILLTNFVLDLFLLNNMRKSQHSIDVDSCWVKCIFGLLGIFTVISGLYFLIISISMKRAYEKSRQTEITQSENSFEITQQETEVIVQSTSSEKPFKDIINNSVPAAEQKRLSMEKGHTLPVEKTKLRFLSQYKVSAPLPKTKIIRKYGAVSRKKYIFPILEYLVLNNGTITTDIADEIIGSRFAKDFTSIDYEFHKDGTRRWEKNVDYATYIMKSNGLLEQDTLSEYKITEYGRQCYLKLKENPLTVINISNNKLTFYSP